MVLRLDISDSDFESRFAAFLNAGREAAGDVDAAVAEIIAEVRARGDAALIALSRRLDDVDLGTLGITIGQDEVSRALEAVDSQTLAALELARDRIIAHHERQRPRDDIYEDELGVTLGQRWTTISSVGLYVPGGTASYPTSVLMNALPAKVAGVDRIAMVVPTPRGEIGPLVLAAARLAGVTEIYRIGGAQAVAALAFGTETVRPVVKIVGPGNAWVAAAKRQVFGHVGIDMIAGPSEVLIIADADNDPDWIAADLLAQAEHDISAQAILITDDGAFADSVAEAVERRLETLARGSIAAASWRQFGTILLLRSLDEAPALADRIAAEHLEIAARDAPALAGRISNAGAIFLGRDTPEAIGDYVAGTNHVLPTARSARFSSGLGVLDFLKRTSILSLDAAGLEALGPAAMTLAEAEGLIAHRDSIAVRLKSKA